jgi:cytochrome c-type biogenesis protein CcmE
VTKKARRLALALGVFVFAAGAVALTLSALRTSVTYFYMPSDLASLETKPGRPIRLGGLVEAGSVLHSEGSSPIVRFAVTDGASRIAVAYAGILPDLFREGQGVVVEGRLQPDGTLLAANVLAKHDENYMPKEVADALREQGRWRE